MARSRPASGKITGTARAWGTRQGRAPRSASAAPLGIPSIPLCPADTSPSLRFFFFAGWTRAARHRQQAPGSAFRITSCFEMGGYQSLTSVSDRSLGENWWGSAPTSLLDSPAAPQALPSAPAGDLTAHAADAPLGSARRAGCQRKAIAGAADQMLQPSAWRREISADRRHNPSGGNWPNDPPQGLRSRLFPISAKSRLIVPGGETRCPSGATTKPQSAP